MSSPLLWFGEAAKFLKNTLKFTDSTAEIVVTGNDFVISSESANLNASNISGNTATIYCNTGINTAEMVITTIAGEIGRITTNETQTEIYNSDGVTDNRFTMGVANARFHTGGTLVIEKDYVIIDPGINMTINTDTIANGSMTLNGPVFVAKTITAGGTTGNQTINKLAGTVNIAAAGTTITVTNSLVTANSIVLTTVRTNDATAIIKNTVCAAGSFVINMNAAVTAETSIGFFVVN